MKAMRMHAYGDVSVIHHDEIPRPVPAAGEVLVRVAATSFNPSEVGLRRGLLRRVLTVDLPHTLGDDLAGTVVTGPQTGRRVIGRIDGGAAADYAIAPAGALVDAPARIPLAHAAALPIVGVTAWQAVFEHAKITAGQRVRIVGRGAIATIATQLVRHAGAEVTDEAPVDALLNLAPVEPAALAGMQSAIRDGGILVSAATPVDGLRDAVHFVVRNDTAHLAELVRLVDAGALRVDVAAERPLSDLPQVHRDAETGRLPGKTVLLPQVSDLAEEACNRFYSGTAASMDSTSAASRWSSCEFNALM